MRALLLKKTICDFLGNDGVFHCAAILTVRTGLRYARKFPQNTRVLRYAGCERLLTPSRTPLRAFRATLLRKLNRLTRRHEEKKRDTYVCTEGRGGEGKMMGTVDYDLVVAAKSAEKSRAVYGLVTGDRCKSRTSSSLHLFTLRRTCRLARYSGLQNSLDTMKLGVHCKLSKFSRYRRSCAMMLNNDINNDNIHSFTVDKYLQCLDSE